MMPEGLGAGSVTRWIGDLKAGDNGAAQQLWERYFERLVRLARKRLLSGRRTGADEDEEDAALSAFDSFCTGAARGRFPLLSDRDDLWKLLVVITARKAALQAQRRRAQKRGGNWNAVEMASADPDQSAVGAGLDAIVGREPTPEFAAMVGEEYRRLLDRLPDDSLRQLALWRMEGYTNDEIAERLGCALRTVARRLDMVRTLWSAEGA
jgi:DNA-directed RNA polymerase specialized sigma24 family protein